MSESDYQEQRDAMSIVLVSKSLDDVTVEYLLQLSCHKLTEDQLRNIYSTFHTDEREKERELRGNWGASPSERKEMDELIESVELRLKREDNINMVTGYYDDRVDLPEYHENDKLLSGLINGYIKGKS
tara:strand:+ start:2855 stop:3238 length:384 start_codon:yes stop_codon:yes gene_type:complete